MTWERQHRCSHWPLCTMHLGVPAPRITPDEVREIRERYRRGDTTKEISDAMRTPWGTVKHITAGETHKGVE